MRNYEKQLSKDLASIQISESAGKNSNVVFAKRIISAHPTNASRFLAFWFSHYWWINRFFFYLIISLSIAGISLGVRLGNATIIGSFMTLLFSSCVYVSIIYLLKKNWFKKLKYKLQGWEPLVNHNSFGAGSNRTRIWRNCKIKLIDYPEKNITLEEQVLRKNIFLIFSDEVHKSFYWKGNNFSDERSTWVFKNGTASGSINTVIIKKIKDLLEQDLTYIKKKFNTLSEVKITVNQNEFYVHEFQDFTSPS